MLDVEISKEIKDELILSSLAKDLKFAICKATEIRCIICPKTTE